MQQNQLGRAKHLAQNQEVRFLNTAQYESATRKPWAQCLFFSLKLFQSM